MLNGPHGSSGTPRVEIVRTRGDIDESLALIAREIERGKRSGVVQVESARALGRKIDGVAAVPEHDGRREAAAIRRHVRRNVRYKMDPVGLDTFETAERTLATGNADCDGQTILVGALAESAGRPVALRAISTRPDQKFDHVYPLIEVEPGQWLAADSTVDKGLGWESKRITNSRTVRVDGGRIAELPEAATLGNGGGSGAGRGAAAWIVGTVALGAVLVWRYIRGSQ